MKKQLLRGLSTMLVLCSLLVMGAGVALAASEAMVVGETAPIYQSANTASTMIAEAINGEMMTVLGEQRSWYHIRFDDANTGANGEGYMLKRDLVADPEYVDALDDALLYALPSTDAKVVGQMAAGDRLAVIGEWDSFWAVNLRAASAFVRKSDVDYTGTVVYPTATNRPNPTQPPVSYTMYVTIRDTNAYTAASSGASLGGVMIAGSYVSIGRIQNGFGQVADNGLWLSMADLRRADQMPYPPVVETSEPANFRYLVVNDGSAVFAQPDTASDVVDTLNDGDVVTVTDTRGSFAQVSYGRQRGWMEMDNLLSMHR